MLAQLRTEVGNLVSKSKETSSTTELVAGLPSELLKMQNLYTGEPMKAGDEPGEFEISTSSAGEKTLRVYLVDGSQSKFALSGAGD